MSRMSITRAVSRRLLFARCSVAIACLAVGEGARSQPAAADGFRVLRARRGSADLRGPGKGATEIWGYDGTVPGPVLRATRGDEVRVRLANDLPAPTTLHWHGV